MGECGCGQMNIIDSFCIGNNVIAVDLYKGCPYCGADFGIRLHIFTKREARHWGVESREKFGSGTPEINSRDLFWFDVDNFKKVISDFEKQDDPREYESLKEWFDEHDYEIFQKMLVRQETRHEPEQGI
jgi:hypothetical protein